MRVALTFDAEHPDRPRCAPGVQEAVLDLLADVGVRASFFLQGRWVEAYPDTARRIADEGHVVGSHGYYHVRMPLLSEEGVRADVLSAEQVIRDVTGRDPRPRFRCPFGIGWDDPILTRLLDERGYRHVGWDVVAYDWDPDRTSRAVQDTVVHGILDGDEGEAIVLLHLWAEPTLDALPGAIKRLRRSGAELVRLDDLRRVTSVARL
jgi:peptidoglycan/xylan/chitin deacetylase (PgdA/CDA1 family)